VRIPYDYSGPDGTIAVTGDTRNDEMAVKRHVGRHGTKSVLYRKQVRYLCAANRRYVKVEDNRLLSTASVRINHTVANA